MHALEETSREAERDERKVDLLHWRSGRAGRGSAAKEKKKTTRAPQIDPRATAATLAN
jgi:hypothetical protein